MGIEIMMAYINMRTDGNPNESENFSISPERKEVKGDV